MITDEEVQKALDYMRDNAKSDAMARAERLYMETWVKTVLAQEQAKQGNVSVAAAEVVARTAPPYLAALEALKASIFEDERRRFLREAAAAKIEAWRTWSANERKGTL